MSVSFDMQNSVIYFAQDMPVSERMSLRDLEANPFVTGRSKARRKRRCQRLRAAEEAEEAEANAGKVGWLAAFCGDALEWNTVCDITAAAR